MVDSINGLGNVQAIQGGKKAATAEDLKKIRDVPPASDEVKISQEALDLQQAEKTAADVKQQLANSDETLGLKPDFKE